MTSISLLHLGSSMVLKMAGLFLVSSLNAFSAGEDSTVTTTPKALAPVLKIAEEVTDTPCFNEKALRGLCSYVGSIEEDPNATGRYTWKYQTKLLDAACVDLEKDSEDVIAEKIRRVWDENKHRFQCNSASFDVPNGNIIKFAVNAKFDHFLGSMVEWKINLNQVDESDKRTVLDYIEYQIERNKGTSIEKRLREYYNMLRKAGAKHRREL